MAIFQLYVKVTNVLSDSKQFSYTSLLTDKQITYFPTALRQLKIKLMIYIQFMSLCRHRYTKHKTLSTVTLPLVSSPKYKGLIRTLLGSQHQFVSLPTFFMSERRLQLRLSSSYIVTQYPLVKTEPRGGNTKTST